MPTIKFQIRTAGTLKPPAEGRVEYFDAAVPGLALRITAAGAKSWVLCYRVPKPQRPGTTGKRAWLTKRWTIGQYPAVTLAQAREDAKEAKRRIPTGHDPAQAKLERHRVETIADLAADYIEKHAKRKKRSWREDDRMLRADILPAWKARAVTDITRRDVRQLVEAIAERGAPIMANRTAALLSKLFRYALDADIIETSPAIRIPRPGVAKSRDRVLTEDEIRQLWQTFDGLDAPMAAFFKLRLVTAQRGNEVASMRWTAVDLEAGWWTIPTESSKNKLPHRVPLSSTALTLVEGLDPGTDERAVYVLDGARGKRQQSEAAATFPIADFRGHDLRRTAASLMAGGGVPRLTISKILNHVETSVTAVYDRHSYDAEKRAALDWWSLKLAAILKGERGKVLAFSKGGA